MLMKEKGVWQVISTNAPVPITDDWNKADEKALTTIGLHVEDDQIQHIRNSATESSKIFTSEIHRAIECIFCAQ